MGSRSLRASLFRFYDLVLRPVTARLLHLATIARASHLAQLASLDRYSDPRCLTRFGYRCTSQNEEDGIIDEILRRVGTTNRFFVEFGVGPGTENNTVALLLGGWRGLWIEAHTGHAARIRAGFSEPLASGQLQLLGEFVTAETVEALFERGGVPAEPDLLSVDIDGNDYWVWRALGRFRPRVVVIEYNASLGRSARVVQPYAPTAGWDETMAFGASLAALEELGREKGYALVGCGITGVNAFFVRVDCLADGFLEPYTAHRHYEPPRFGETGAGHPVRWGRFDPV